MLIENVDTKLATASFKADAKCKFKNQVGIYFWKFLFFD